MDIGALGEPQTRNGETGKDRGNNACGHAYILEFCGSFEPQFSDDVARSAGVGLPAIVIISIFSASVDLLPRTLDKMETAVNLFRVSPTGAPGGRKAEATTGMVRKFPYALETLLGPFSLSKNRVHDRIDWKSRNVRDVDKANLRGAVRTAATQRQTADSVFVEERTFDKDGRLLSVSCLRDGVPTPAQNQLSGVDFSVKSVHNPDGSRVDIQQVIGIDGWSMEGLNVALGTHGASVARTTFDTRGTAIETVFLDNRNEVTSKITYSCDEGGRILQAVQTLGPGFGSALPAEVREELHAQLPDGEWCRLSFHYDERDRVTESTSSLAGKQAHHDVTTYNDKGDKETVTTDDQGTTRFEYEYDPEGNWTRQVTHHPAGTFVENRVITYH